MYLYMHMCLHLYMYVLHICGMYTYMCMWHCSTYAIFTYIHFNSAQHIVVRHPGMEVWKHAPSYPKRLEGLIVDATAAIRKVCLGTTTGNPTESDP